MESLDEAYRLIQEAISRGVPLANRLCRSFCWVPEGITMTNPEGNGDHIPLVEQMSMSPSSRRTGEGGGTRSTIGGLVSGMEEVLAKADMGLLRKYGGDDDCLAEEDPFGEAGQPCNICSSETRTQTHFATPCQHSACERCWETWTQSHATCMICGKAVHKVHRFSRRLAPAGGGKGEIGEANIELEDAMAELLETVVRIRTEIREAGDRLEECGEHLGGRSMLVMGAEARSSVASVEASTVADQVGALLELVEGNSWVRLRLQVGRVQGVIVRLGALLDEAHARDYDNAGGNEDGDDGGGGCASRQQGLEDTERLLEGCTSGNIAGQWNKVESALNNAVENQIPQLVVSLRGYGAGVQGTSRVDRLRALSRACIEDAGARLGELMPELDLMLIRVQSCFDGDRWKGRRGRLASAGQIAPFLWY